jgi:BNR repeat-containing family member
MKPIALSILLALSALLALAGESSRILVKDGAWCWFQDPRAVRSGDKTFLSYVTSRGDIAITAFNHKTRSVTHATLHAGLQKDDHNNGGIHLRPDGRLMVFYSKHNDPKGVRYRISRKPADISQWGTEKIVPVAVKGGHGVTYSHPVMLKAEKNRLYLFWRGNNLQPTFSWSDDQGKTWAPARNWFVNSKHKYPYVKIASNGKKRIHILFTDTHPVFSANRVNYMVLEDGAFRKADGSIIRKVADVVSARKPDPVKPGEADEIYVGKEDARGWIWDLAPDKDDRPVLLYSVLSKSGMRHRYRYARWTGKNWFKSDLTEAGHYIGNDREKYYSGGMTLNDADPDTLYLSRQPERGKGWRIEQWTTKDSGKTWKQRVVSAVEKTVRKVRPVVPQGARPGDELQVLWMQGRYTHYIDYLTTIMAWPQRKNSAKPGMRQ